MSDDAGRGAGLFSSLRRLGHTALGAARVRLEIVSSELEEQGLRLSQLLLLAAAAGFCLALTVVLLIAFVVVLYWNTHRLVALGGFTLLFALTGAGLLIALRRLAGSRPRFLAATIAELEKDRREVDDAGGQ